VSKGSPKSALILEKETDLLTALQLRLGFISSRHSPNSSILAANASLARGSDPSLSHRERARPTPGAPRALPTIVGRRARQADGGVSNHLVVELKKVFRLLTAINRLVDAVLCRSCQWFTKAASIGVAEKEEM